MLQYFGYLMQSSDSLEKTLMLGKVECMRRRGWQRIRWLDGITDSVDMNLSKLWEIAKARESWHAAVHEVTKSWTWLNYWTKTTSQKLSSCPAQQRHTNSTCDRCLVGCWRWVSLWSLQMGRLMYSDWVTKPTIQDLIYAFSFDHTHLWENRVKEHKVKTDHFLYNLSVWTVLPSPDFPKSASQTSSLLALRKSLSHKIWRFAYPFKPKTYKWNIKHYSEVWGEFHLCLNNWVDYQVKAGKKT